jgi:ADP-ribose pyrophosphatase
MTPNDVEIIEHETVFQGYFRIDRYKLRHNLFQGGWGAPIQRELFERGHAVGVVLYDPDSDRVVLTEQFRVGALAAGRGPWVTEIVAGIIEHGEAPPEVARRETQEEAGCDVLDLVPICDYLVSPGGTSETVKLFCARVDASRAEGIHGLPEEGEDIRVWSVPLSAALEDLNAGRVTNSMTIIALQWLALNHAALRRRWGAAS